MTSLKTKMKNLIKIEDGGKVMLFLVILGWTIIFLVDKFVFFGVTVVVIFHELGHYFVAKYYDNFESFVVCRRGVGIKRKRGSETMLEFVGTNISGFLLGTVVASLMLLLNLEFSLVVTLLMGNFVGSAGDFYSLWMVVKK